MTITNTKNFDVSNLNIEKPNKNEDDLYSSKILYNNENLIFQTPKVKITKVSEKNLTIEIADDNLYDSLGLFDNHIIKLTSDNSKDWFSNEYTIDDIEELYKRSISTPYKSTNKCNMKININNTVQIYNKNKELLSINDLIVDNEIVLLISCSKLLIYKNYCIPKWEAIQIKVKEKKNKVRNEYLFKDLDNENQPDEKLKKLIE